jgi:hypothetical protein
VVVAVVIVAWVITTHPGLLVCPPPRAQGFGGVGGDGLCLPTLFPDITGANPVAILVSWMIVIAVIAAVLWLMARFIERQGDI